VVEPLIAHWEATPPERVATYAAGSWGPAEADELLRRDGFAWRAP
jgi:glucose-6-phosphate 1-dehydrogenase